MEERNKSGITTSQFLEATTDHALVDKFGRYWHIMNILSERSRPSLIARLSGCDPMVLIYDSELGILDEDMETIKVFNDPSAHIAVVS